MNSYHIIRTYITLCICLFYTSTLIANEPEESVVIKNYKSNYNLFHKISYQDQAKCFHRDTLTLNAELSFHKDSTIYTSRLRDILLYASERNILLPDHADYLAKVNEEDLSAPEKIAFRILKSGKIETAIEHYHKIKLNHYVQKSPVSLSDSVNIHSARNQYDSFLTRMAIILQFAGGKENFTEAEQILKELADKDNSCLENMLPYVDYQISRRVDISPEWTTKLIRSCRNAEEESKSLNRIGINALFNTRIAEAASYFHAAEKEFQKFSVSERYHKNHPVVIDYLSKLNDIAQIYNRKKMYDSATIYFQKAVELNRVRMKQSDGIVHKPFLHTYYNYISHLQTINNHEHSRMMIDEALQHADNKQHCFNEEIEYYRAQFYFLLSECDLKAKKHESAFENMLLSYDIARQLSEKTNSYYAFLSSTINRLRPYYMKDSEKYTSLCKQSIDYLMKEGVYNVNGVIQLNEIRRKLAEMNLKTNNWAQAMAVYEQIEQSYTLYRPAFPGQLAFRHIDIKNQYATLLLRAGKPESAIAKQNSALKLLTSVKETADNQEAKASWILHTVLKLSKSLKTNNQRNEAKEILKKNEYLLNQIGSEKNRQKWSNQLMAAYHELEEL